MKFDWRIIELPYEFTFTISRASRDNARNVLVELEHTSGNKTFTGLGEAVPAAFYGESAEEVVAFYEQLTRDNVLDGLGPFDIQELSRRLDAAPGNMAAKAAIDMAFYDLQGKLLDMPLHRLWGLDSARVPKSSYTIGIADEAEVRRKTEIALSRGYDILKVKLGSPNDIALFEAIRELAPHPDITIRVDANAGWEIDGAVEICRYLAEHHVEFVEEPLRLGSPVEDYARLKAESPIELMADESCHVLKDVPRCAEFFHSINLKPTKTGGLTEALRMIHAARALGLKIMLGGFGESSLSVTAFAQLAPLVDFTDLDAALLMAEDPFEGIHWQGNAYTLPKRPGLGVVSRS